MNDVCFSLHIFPPIFTDLLTEKLGPTPPFCQKCHRSTKFSQFSECCHSVYCPSCHISKTRCNIPYISKPNLCPICQMNNSYFYICDIKYAPHNDSDFFCFSCFAHLSSLVPVNDSVISCQFCFHNFNHPSMNFSLIPIGFPYSNNPN
jgi:hypothetical protein